MFETLVKCHERVGHSGRRKTWDEVKKNYAGIRFDVIPLFLSTCKQCNERRPAKNPPSGRPMIALGFLTRVQMDLIDFSSRPDGDYRYILHVWVQMKILMVIVLQMTILMVHQMFLGLMIILMMYWLSLQQVLGGLT